MMRIRYKIPLITLGAVVLTALISSFSNYQTNIKLIENAKKKELKMVARLIQNQLVEQSNVAAGKVAFVVSRPEVIKAFRAKNRDELISIMIPTFKIQRDKFGVRDAQFTLPPATTFLRLHNLALYNDDNSSFSEMIIMSMKNQQSYQGIEIGRSGVSLRAIDVVKDAQGVIGTFEIGMSFGTILDELKMNTNFDAAIFINDDLMTSIATSRHRASQDRIFGELQGIGATDWAKILPNMSTQLLSKVNDVKTITQRINGVDYGVILIPLLDFKNSEIGVIVAISNFSNYQSQLSANLISSIAFGILQTLILYGVVLVSFHVLLMRPLDHLNEVISARKNHQQAEINPDLKSRSDEIGELAKNLDALNVECNKPESQHDA